MLARYMGPHYGNNVIAARRRHLQLSLLISPPVSARHIEYQHVWLKPHRVSFTFHWKPSRASIDADLRRRYARRMLTRRRLLLRGAAARAAAGGAAVGLGLDRVARQPPSRCAHGRARRQPAGLPARQHAWAATLARDPYGNPIPPRFDRLLFFDVNGSPDAGRTRGCWRPRCGRSSARYRGVPPGCCSRPAGDRATSSTCCGVPSPIPQAKGLSDFELPAIDDYDLCLHLACDDEQRLAAVEAALRARRAARRARTGRSTSRAR